MHGHRSTVLSRQAQIAIEWWRDCRIGTNIPFHAVARGLGIGYRDLERRCQAYGIDVLAAAECRRGLVSPQQAYRLLAAQCGLAPGDALVAIAAYEARCAGPGGAGLSAAEYPAIAD